MDKRKLTAPCGLDCFNCPSYEGIITEDGRKYIAGLLHIPVEEASCKGCRDEDGHCLFGQNQECATWDCVKAKGLNLCSDCSDFPCEKLAPTQQGANFPHNMKVYNLCRIRLLGLDGWIEEAADIRRRYYGGKFIVGKGPVEEEL